MSLRKSRLLRDKMRRLAASVLAVAACAATLSGCGQTKEILKLKVGDCYNIGPSQDNVVADIPVLKCNTPHNAEIYARYELPDGPFPGDAAVFKQSSKACRSLYKDFSGISLSQSKNKITAFLPTVATWEDNGDRTVLCVVFSPSGQISHSLKGLKQ